MSENEIAAVVVDAAYKVFRAFGPGLLESAYRAMLKHELQRRGLRVQAEAPVPLLYESMRVEVAFRIDLLVEDSVIVELKSIEHTSPVHRKQVLTYLKLTHKRLGLLINFGEASFRQAVTRLVNQLPE